ncbi:hypothetical protein M8994_20470, partial [Brucella sp. 21LCYQ03]|nr:hypothetical protein [Brucella sp. 21LCYQ03]
MKKYRVRQEDLTDRDREGYIGFSRGVLINLLKNGDFQKDDDIAKVRAVVNAIPLTSEEEEIVLPKVSASNAKAIGEIKQAPTDQGLKEISPGYYLLTAELIPIHAQAGYLLGYQDQEYIDTLPLYTTTVNKYVTGTYKFIEASGDSMDNGDIREAIPDGTVMLCREVSRQYWQSKLHTHS